MPQATPRRILILTELGLTTLASCPLDIHLLILQRFTRLFAYGASTLILVSYLESLGHSRTRSGLFMTLTLAGDILISFFLTLTADKIGRKATLAAGAVLMALSGVAFALLQNYWLLLAAAVFGVISPSGNEIGPFRAVEESIVAHLTTHDQRSDVYAWYTLLGTAGTAFGIMACGWATHALVAAGRGLGEAYRLLFAGYALLGVVKLLLTLALSPAVEADRTKRNGPRSESEPLLNGQTAAPEEVPANARPTWASLVPHVTAESRAIAATLCLLFGLDAFASGLAPLSWVTFYFRSRFDIEEGRLGSIFFATSLISAASVVVASSISKRLGNVKTMVFTHLPSSMFLALIPVPSNLFLSLSLLALRACTQSMDVAPRSAFLAAIFLPSERTAVMGLVNVVKTSAQSLGPLITGVLANHHLFWVSFVCAGSLKVCYDLGLLVVFKEREQRRAGDEETT
ncbi:Major facilitator superfamily domain, general substrate transporter [Metarhizium album ARSEF 1941]|uniref:Major facilitator superfamily domain, general substrate transporter n=1 Tax=Metarhizium album (strain ARSEF 1941) TaxID=1081103 RepID=A0A0B2WRR0_METAS|nr:Major facilitator superfamily domain, general substrate transporter [Metarhizium album ARSEF 1941]KHN96187.1 Major facilitator superfamily domain, general substrate transporter [Metarhizium album ARSEF 1941]